MSLGVRALSGLLPVLTALGIALSAGVGSAQDARSLLDRYLQRTATTSVNDLLVVQEMVLIDPDGGQKISGVQRLYVVPPDRRRLETELESQKMVTLVNGARLVIQNNGKASELSPSDHRDTRDLVLPFRRSADELLAQWTRQGIRTGVIHQTNVNGRAVTVIGAAPDDRSSPSIWLDPEYGVVRLTMRDDRSSKPIELVFSDFRPIAGAVSYPHRQETFMDGRPFIIVTVKSVKVNSSLSSDLFDPDRLLKESLP